MLRQYVKLETLRRVPLPTFLAVAYAAGLAYVLLLPDLSQEFYVDENALVIHSIQSAMAPGDVADAFGSDAPNATSPSVRAFLDRLLSPHGIVVREFDRDIHYAVLRSRRSNGEDSIAIVAPYHPHVAFKRALSGLHVAVALLTYLNAVKWLAKDVILVCVPAARPALLSKWLDAYHAVYSGEAPTGAHLPLDRAGSIRAAFVIDLPPSTSFETLSLTTSSSHGILPNFDIVAVVQYVTAQHNVPISISDNYAGLLQSSSRRDDALQWFNRYRPMLRFMADSVTGAFSGGRPCVPTRRPVR